MISSDVIFGNLNSREDLGLIFTHKEIGTPDVRTEYVEVPGRPPIDLSELTLGTPQYNMRNITVDFEYTGDDKAAERTLVFGKLHGRKMRIQFLDDPDWYYTGRCVVKYTVNRSTLTFNVEITAEPFKRLVSETPVTFTEAGMINNPYDFASRPLLRINGSGAGTVTIGNKTITLLEIDGYVDIDSMLMDCFKGLSNKNNVVRLSEFPKLNPGNTGISFSGGVTSVEITGRWWTL